MAGFSAELLGQVLGAAPGLLLQAFKYPALEGGTIEQSLRGNPEAIERYARSRKHGDLEGISQAAILMMKALVALYNTESLKAIPEVILTRVRREP